MKKIDVLVNGNYLWSTNSHRRCKDAVERAEVLMKEKPYIRRTIRKKAGVTKREKINLRAFFAK